MEKEQLFLAAIQKELLEFCPGADVIIGKRLQGFNSASFQEIISMAGRWSLGSNKGATGFGEQPLQPIFEYIQPELNPKTCNYPFKPLSLQKKDIFPVRSSNTSSDDYKQLQTGFATALTALDRDKSVNSLHVFNESLLYRLKRFVWCVPVSAEQPTVSLYEYLKLKGAIAQALYTAGTQAVHPLLMLNGGISGIQKFIYNIHSRRAARSLKGRSFYLQLLIDSIIQKIILHPDIDVTPASVIYASGGKFYMLLPNTPEVVSALQAIEEEVIHNIYNEYKGSLYMTMDWLAFGFDAQLKLTCEKSVEEKIRKTGQDIALGELWAELLDRGEQKKLQKFKKLFLGDYQYITNNRRRFDDFFEPIDEGHGREGTETCAVTREVIFNPDEQKHLLSENEDGEKVWVKEKVREQVRLGDQLKDVDYFITYQSRNSYSSRVEIDPLDLRIRHRFLDEEETRTKGIRAEKIAKIRHVNQPAPVEGAIAIKDVPNSSGFVFYGGNKQAANEDDTNKSFEELTEPDEGSSEFKRLGILRMDVDNLGLYFRNGLPATQQSFAAYATFSSQLDLFFSGYLNTIWQTSRNGYTANVNILYSGGDDIFVLGRWDKVILFAHEVRQEFREFVCNRENISISAGIAFVGAKFPITKGAKEAGNAEKAAKKHTINIGDKTTSKNAVSLLSMAVSWQGEFAFVQQMREVFARLLSEGVISKNLVQQLFSYMDIKNQGKYDWWWLSAYTLARAQKNATDKQKETLSMLKEALVTGQVNYERISYHAGSRERMLDLVCLAARLADFDTRK